MSLTLYGLPPFKLGMITRDQSFNSIKVHSVLVIRLFACIHLYSRPEHTTFDKLHSFNLRSQPSYNGAHLRCRVTRSQSQIYNQILGQTFRRDSLSPRRRSLGSKDRYRQSIEGIHEVRKLDGIREIVLERGTWMRIVVSSPGPLDYQSYHDASHPRTAPTSLITYHQPDRFTLVP